MNLNLNLRMKSGGHVVSRAPQKANIFHFYSPKIFCLCVLF